MKLRFFLTAVMIAAVTPLFAGGIFYNSNQSAEYFRTYERNAATDNADAVYYNMAGTTKMKDGLYVNGSNQMLFQEATVKTENNPVSGDKTYKSDNPVWLCPNFYVLYKQDNWSAFTGIETIGATAIREWKDGLPSLDLAGKQQAGFGNPASAGYTALETFVGAGAGSNPANYISRSYLKGESYYAAWRIGGAYAVNNLLSVGAAGRVVYSQQKVEGYIDAGIVISPLSRAEFDYTDEALGYSGEINMDIFPVDGLTVSFTYEMATPLEFKRNVNGGKNGGGMIIDGEKKNLDLPQALRFGISYNFTEKFRVEFGADAYLEKYADFERLDDPASGIDSDKSYSNTYEEGLAFEYTANRYFLASIGFNLTQIGQKKSGTLDTSIPGAHADYWSVGFGCQVTPVDDLKINLGVGYTGFRNTYKYADKNDRAISPVTTKEYNKEYVIVAIGAEYRFM
jgi:long-subunit fatty acid transport protein